MDDLPITQNVTLSSCDLSWKAVRASGPGGQNVNKVSTKVELCFDLEASADLNDATKQRVRRHCARNLNARGQLVISSQAARTQRQNLSLALSELVDVIRRALVTPKPRRKTQPTRASKAARVRDKRHQSTKKRARAHVADES
jgi:ribosome-associated protein